MGCRRRNRGASGFEFSSRNPVSFRTYVPLRGSAMPPQISTDPPRRQRAAAQTDRRSRGPDRWQDEGDILTYVTVQLLSPQRARPVKPDRGSPRLPAPQRQPPRGLPAGRRGLTIVGAGSAEGRPPGAAAWDLGVRGGVQASCSGGGRGVAKGSSGRSGWSEGHVESPRPGRSQAQCQLGGQGRGSGWGWLRRQARRQLLPACGWLRWDRRDVGSSHRRPENPPYPEPSRSRAA